MLTVRPKASVQQLPAYWTASVPRYELLLCKLYDEHTCRRRFPLESSVPLSRCTHPWWAARSCNCCRCWWELPAGGHIPYRDSKLTRILQPSLGGNAKTAIICNVTPAACHVEESHSTLRFACRAKRVVNNAVVNEVLSDAAVLKRQAKEIEELRKALASSG